MNFREIRYFSRKSWFSKDFAWLSGSVEVCQTLSGSVGMDSAGLPEAGGSPDSC